MKYTLFIISCVILLGVAAFFRKLALDKIDPYQFQVIVGIIDILFIPIWLYMSSSKPLLEYDINGVLFSIICILALTASGVIFSFLVKGSNNIGTISALVGLSPIITLTLSCLFLSEHLSISKIAAFVLAIASVILINF